MTTPSTSSLAQANVKITSHLSNQFDPKKKAVMMFDESNRRHEDSASIKLEQERDACFGYEETKPSTSSFFNDDMAINSHNPIEVITMC